MFGMGAYGAARLIVVAAPGTDRVVTSRKGCFLPRRNVLQAENTRSTTTFQVAPVTAHVSGRPANVGGLLNVAFTIPAPDYIRRAWHLAISIGRFVAIVIVFRGSTTCASQHPDT